ncbi:MAG: hypothetical protein KDJ35_08400 [Alphaproteobacteria bacterium]|nr:hypothetical protein [Alphaproteobacteria bacterium]
MRQNNALETIRRYQSGNAFLIILLGVVLFAALSFTVARSMRSSTTTKLSGREITLAVSDLMDYTQKVERAVNRLRRKGCSENELSFENDIVAGYTNAGAPGDGSCNIFSTNGGNVTWRTFSFGAQNFEYWGNDAVQDIGTTNSDLMMTLLINGETTLCSALNKQIGLGSTIAIGSGDEDASLFTGSFGDSGTETISETPSETTACFDPDGGEGYYFYHVLLER